VCGVESSNFQVTVVPTETVSVIGVNMKFVISTVDPALAVAEPPVGAAAVAGVEAADVLAPLPLELELHAAAARTAISATKTRSGRRGRTEDPRDVSARFISAPFARGDAGPDCLNHGNGEPTKLARRRTLGLPTPAADAIRGASI
jgi:hypothetical protein